MPNLSKCKFVEGNLYCWDSEKKDFIQIELKLIINPAVHKKVVAAFMEDGETDGQDQDDKLTG